MSTADDLLSRASCAQALKQSEGVLDKILYRGLPFSPAVAPLVAHMPAVDEYRENLLRLQAAWDSLSMLGQMSGTVPDIAGTRSAFESLTATLLDNLARRLLASVEQRLRSRARVAIDILVRNLFERTADVGFLASDSALCAHAQRFHADESPVPEADRAAIEARFKDYVAKYSVYDDVVVMSPQGRVLARLDRSVPCLQSHEPWITRAALGSGYVEHHGCVEVLGGRRALVYAHAIRAGRAVVGVLCLSFRFDDEMQGVFGQLLDTEDRAVITLVDAQRRVVASSDPWQVPVGAPLHGAASRSASSASKGALDHPVSRSAEPSHERLRFAGRDYLAMAALPTGYEGYGGPGWSALMLLPIESAFEDASLADADPSMSQLAATLDTHELFDAELLAVAPQAQRIERDLSRLLWNGRLRHHSDASTQAFAATLLREVGQTGERIRQVFDQATGKLHRFALSSVFEQAQHHARLAIDIMDRNLYERANDCRWWALDGVLRHTLAQAPAERDLAAATDVLQRINGLYLVYALLVLFDAEGRVVATSRPDASDWLGRVIDDSWVAETLALRHGQQHAVSRHAPCALYGGRATYVYSAALRAPQDEMRVTGGIAIVFDGAPQFNAMLADALPPMLPGQAPEGRCALLVTRSGEVVASTDARWPVGAQAPLPPGWEDLARGAAGHAVVDLDGIAHAAGFAMAGGYREYPVAACHAQDDVGALMLTRLGRRVAERAAVPPPFVGQSVGPLLGHLLGHPLGHPLGHSARPAGLVAEAAARSLQVAGLRVGDQWLGLPAANVVEALEGSRITALPNASADVLGMVAFEGRMLQVLDLALMRDGQAASSHEASPLVVIQTDDGHRFAVRVDALGPVFDVPQSAIQVLNCGSGSSPERLIRGEGQVMNLLDAQALSGRSNDLPMAASPAPLMAVG